MQNIGIISPAVRRISWNSDVDFGHKTLVPWPVNHYRDNGYNQCPVIWGGGPDNMCDFYRATLCIARSTCMLSKDVRLSVHPSVTRRYSVETAKYIWLNFFHHRVATPL